MIALVSSGLTTREIARKLSLQPCTVDAFVRHAMAKLQARTRVHASVIASAQTEGALVTADLAELTEEQQRLLLLLADGHTLSEAAARLHVSLRTAHRRLHAARAIIGVRSNVQALAALADRLAPAG